MAEEGEKRETGPKILAFCPNPAIDIWSEAEAVRPVRKIRTSGETQDPGGGGVNVTRVITELGGNAEVIALAGGTTGRYLAELLTERRIAHRIMPISGHTRISYTVHEHASGLDYRFVAPGPIVTDDEIAPCLEAIRASDAPYVVASGSLPPGAPEDMFIRIADMVAGRGGRFVLDTSGEALLKTLRHGRVFLVKPSIGELGSLVGHRLDETTAREAAADLVRNGSAEMVAVTMGASGAILASAGGIVRCPAPAVHARSTVGTGDSFLAAMVWALAEGRTPEDALAYGVAAGAAAVLEPGTKLCRRSDVENFYNCLPAPSFIE